MDTLVQMKEERMGLVKQLRDLTNKADDEKRSLNAEETRKWEAINADIEAKTAEIEKREQLQSYESGYAAPVANPEDNGQGNSEEKKLRAFNEYLKRGQMELPEMLKRDLEVSTDNKGGYLAPEQFVAQLIKGVDDSVYMRQLATRFTLTGAESLGVPTLATDAGDADWTSEVPSSDLAVDSDMAFGKKELSPNLLTKQIKRSRKLLYTSALSPDQIILSALERKIGYALENAYLTGDGGDRPLGVFEASSDGISASRDVDDGNTSTAITFDGLINARFSLKEAYQRNATWIFHRDVVKEIRKLKDDNDQYIWEPSTVPGEPDRVLGVPYMMSEFAPNDFSAGEYVGIIGDFSYYWIVDSLAMEIQRLEELYAGRNQVGFIARFDTDGQPVLEEAFARVQLSS